MPPKKSSNVSPATLALYEKLVASHPGIERKGDTVPYTSHNGHMFSMISSGIVALRLPVEEREAFLKKYKTRLHEAYGAILKEYVQVPETLLENTKELKKYFDISYKYVSGLKPKPAKKAAKK
jgi:TfoX/Sxy family transcriptional regulator of competence genes